MGNSKIEIQDRIHQIRSRTEVTTGVAVRSVLSAVAIGLALGLFAKLADNIGLPFIFDQVGGRLGVWIFTAVLLSAFCGTAWLAAIRVLAFFSSALAIYYAYTVWFLHFFPRTQILFWSLVAMLSPFCAFIMWFSRGRGWFAGLCAALPVAVLFSEIYTTSESSPLLWVIYLLMILCLVLFLPESGKQRRFVLLMALVLSLVLIKGNVLGLLFGGRNTML